MTQKSQIEREGVLDAVETAYFATQMLAGCNGKSAVNAYNAAVDEFNSAVNRYYAIGAANDNKGKLTLHQAKITAEVTARSIIDYATDLKGVQRGIIRAEFVYTPQRHSVDIDEAVVMQRGNHGSMPVDDTCAFALQSINNIVKPIVDKASDSAEFELVLQEPPKVVKRKEKSDDEQLSIDFDAWRQCALDFDLQAASVNTVESRQRLSRRYHGVNRVNRN